MKRVLSNLCDLDLKVKGQITYTLVNASTSQLLDVATSNFAGTVHRSYDLEGTGQHFV